MTVASSTPASPSQTSASKGSPTLSNEKSLAAFESASSNEADELQKLGYTAELQRTRGLWTLTFQNLSIAAIPFGVGSPLITCIYGGGQLSIFIGWIIVLILTQCVAMSVGEIASRYPTSAGPYYWSFQLAQTNKAFLSYVTGWVWLLGNWTITLSVNFGFASLISASITICRPGIVLTSWQLLLLFYCILLVTFLITAFANRLLPLIDTICAAWTVISIVIVLVALSTVAREGRHSPIDTLVYYDNSLSGWGNFSFLIGLLPCSFTFVAFGMIAAMSEEVSASSKRGSGGVSIIIPQAIALCVPVGGLAGFFFIIPICAILPDLKDILANSPAAQSLPYIFFRAMGTTAGAAGLLSLVIGTAFFGSISITVAASRTTWAFARDNAMPGSSVLAKTRQGLPLPALTLVTLVQALLGLLNLGNTSAFIAFTSAGTIGLSLGYAVPITLSVLNKRKEVSRARWNCGKIAGPIFNAVGLAWIAFELVLFSMPTTLPVTAVGMNYASVIIVGCVGLSTAWYFLHAWKVFKGPPASEGLAVEADR